MLLESGLGLCVPDLTLFVREVLPGEADDLGESAVVCLDLRGDVLTLNERRSEENESVGRARDVVLWLLLAMSRTTAGGTLVGRREEDRFGRGVVDEDRGIIVCNWSYISREGDALMGSIFHLGGGPC